MARARSRAVPLRTLTAAAVIGLACGCGAPGGGQAPATPEKETAGGGASRPPSTEQASGVGFAAIRVRDPVGGGEMPGYVFYPSAQAAGTTRLGPYPVAAVADAPPNPGAKPLVVISHGSGGSNLGHHDLATYLAGHGFVTATVEHPKDNFHDRSGVGHGTVLAGRPRQVSAAISALLADPHHGPLIDPARIGVAGFSAGGYTSLVLVGAVPRFALFPAYCDRHPDDAEICGVLRRLLAEEQAPGKAEEERKLLIARALQDDLKRWGDTADPRVKAAFAMAPMSLVFDEAGLATVARPVFLYYGEADQTLRPAENALHIRPLLKTLAGVRSIPGADHWVFVPPCTPELAGEAKAICTDPPGIDRAAWHARINADALAFFQQALSVAPR